MTKKLIPLLLIPILLLCNYSTVNAYYEDFPEPYLIRCTCYTAPEGAITASGQEVREGIVAGKPEWRGYVCIIYENDNGKIGDVIGFFEVLDTGGKNIKAGKSIDVYRDSLDRCYDWIGEYGDYVYVQIFPAEG